MALTGSISASLSLLDQIVGDLAVERETPSISASWTIADGAGAGQASIQWSDARSLATGANESIDLAGVLTGLRGQVVTFTKVKGLIIYALPTNTTDLTLSRPAANGFPLFSSPAALAALAPGGFFVYANPSAGGVAVTAGTGDLMTMTNAAGATATYQIGVFGS